ncbi:hypothetical protein P4U07_13495 [Bacillus mycoides]|nr:hypothetical protein [Bacillus mycoides]
MLNQKVISSVVLPAWVHEGTINEQEVMRNAYRYLNRIPQRYPGYRILEVNDGIAKCERCDG